MSAKQELAVLIFDTANAKTLKKVVFSKPVSGDVTRTVGTLREIGGNTKLQLEHFHKDNKATHENLSLDKGEAPLLAHIENFAQINLITTQGDAEYRCNKRGNSVLLGANKLRAASGEQVSVVGNNKEKNYILTGHEPFLQLLDVADKNGRVPPDQPLP